MARTKSIAIKSIKEEIITLKLVGDSDLILHKKTRLYELSEVWRQNNPEGAELPAEFLSKNKWEQFITGISWEKPITFHDDNINLYTEEEWKDYMENNRPCILTCAFGKSFMEAFKSFGYKTSSKKAGTDFQRALNFVGEKTPINFATVITESKLVPNTGIDKKNVVCNQNVFSGWTCDLTIRMPEKVFPIETVVSVIATAGQYIGIGTQRKNGYGRYHIEKATSA